MLHFFGFGFGSGVSKARTASSNTVVRPSRVSAEHSFQYKINKLKFIINKKKPDKGFAAF
jgi:hypothetical protein